MAEFARVDRRLGVLYVGDVPTEESVGGDFTELEEVAEQINRAVEAREVAMMVGTLQSAHQAFFEVSGTNGLVPFETRLADLVQGKRYFRDDWITGDEACGFAFDAGLVLGRLEAMHSGTWAVLKDTLMEHGGQVGTMAKALLAELGFLTWEQSLPERTRRLREAVRVTINHFRDHGGLSTPVLRNLVRAFDDTSKLPVDRPTYEQWRDGTAPPEPLSHERLMEFLERSRLNLPMPPRQPGDSPDNPLVIDVHEGDRIDLSAVGARYIQPRVHVRSSARVDFATSSPKPK